MKKTYEIVTSYLFLLIYTEKSKFNDRLSTYLAYITTIFS